MKLVLIGIQGSGKSTQGNLLSKQLGIPYLSTGHIFREIAKEKTELGAYVKLTMNAGILISDAKTIEIVNDYISRSEYKHGYIIDGFPRTVRQAKEFHNHVDKVIYLDIPDKEALWRIVYRNDQTRADETLPALKRRIELFNKFTKPVLEYYQEQDKLITLDGTQSIKIVNKAILKSIGKQMIKNQITTWEKKKHAIIAIVGLTGAGKSEAAGYLESKGLPVIYFGQVVRDEMKKQKLPETEESHKKTRMGLREIHGLEAMAVLNEDNIRKAFEKHKIVVIDGMRSWEEYLYLMKKMPKVTIHIVALHTDKELRYRRLAKRKGRAQSHFEERDISELIAANMGPTIAFADYVIKNNFSKEDLQDKLEQVYRQIYYS